MNGMHVRLSLIIKISTISVLGFDELPPQNPKLSTSIASDDTEPPTLVITQPENYSSVSGWFSLSVIASDNEFIDRVDYREDSETEYRQMRQNESDSTKYIAQIDTRKFTNGVHIFEITAYDVNDNFNRSVLLLAIFNLEPEADIYGYNVTGLTGECPCLDDTNTSLFWNKVQAYPIEEFNGYIKFAHNFTHIFGLFVYDIALEWISLQFDNDGDGECMEDGEDIWWFSENQELSDYTAVGFGSPIEDNNQEISFESGTFSDNDSSYKFIEMVRAFVTEEPEDVKFQFGVQIGMVFASNDMEFHKQGTRTNFTLALKANPPEGVTGTIQLNNTLAYANSMNDLLVYGGIGFIINVTLIIGLVAYNKKRQPSSK